MRAHAWAAVLAAAAALVAGDRPAAAADQTTNYRVSVAHDNAVVDSMLTPPLRVRWGVAIGHSRWRVLPKGRVRATGSYPAGRLGRRDDVLICTPEPRHDGYGRPSPIDASCGSPRIVRATGSAAYARPRSPEP